MSPAQERTYPGYETTFITRTEMPDAALAKLRDKISDIIKSFDGEIVMNEEWGKRKLAYAIRKETRGTYTFFAYSGKPGVVAEIERNLRIEDNMLRFLSIQLDDEFSADKYTKPDLQALGAPPRRFSRDDDKFGGDRGSRFDRGDRGDRGDRPDRPERADRSEGTRRS